MFILACLVVALLIWFSHTFYDHELLNPIVRYTAGTLIILIGAIIAFYPNWNVSIELFILDCAAGAATLAPRLWHKFLNRRATKGL